MFLEWTTHPVVELPSLQSELHTQWWNYRPCRVDHTPKMVELPSL